MHVKDIELQFKDEYDDDTILPYLLKNNIDNEKYFQTVFFEVKMDVDLTDNLMDMVYRIFYEDIYLHNHDATTDHNSVSFYDDDTRTFYMQVNLSELIGYINMAAPPLILNMIKNQGYKDIDEFISVLKELLIQERIRVPYYTMKFKECMGLNQFQTKTTYNFDRMDALRSISTGKDPVIDIEAAFGYPIETIATEDVEEVHLQCMINFMNDGHVNFWLQDILGDLCGRDSIINVFKDDKRGYFIELNIPDYSSKKYRYIDSLIKKSYLVLYKK